MTGCSAIECRNSSEKGYQMSRFPRRDPEVRIQWILNVGRPQQEIGPNSRLCEEHFAEDMWEIAPNKKRKLKRNAVPTIFPTHTSVLVLDAEPPHMNQTEQTMQVSPEVCQNWTMYLQHTDENTDENDRSAKPALHKSTKLDEIHHIWYFNGDEQEVNSSIGSMSENKLHHSANFSDLSTHPIHTQDSSVSSISQKDTTEDEPNHQYMEDEIQAQRADPADGDQSLERTKAPNTSYYGDLASKTRSTSLEDTNDKNLREIQRLEDELRREKEETAKLRRQLQLSQAQLVKSRRNEAMLIEERDRAGANIIHPKTRRLRFR